MLTAQKRKYALALMSGMSQKDAAVKAGYSEKSARSKGSQLAKDPEVIAFIERKKRERVEVDDEPAYRRNVYTPAVNTLEEKRLPAASSAGEYEDPLDFLKSVMNNVGYEIETRKDAAKAMLPYMHQKKGEGGKKDAKAEAAKKAANKFAIQQPPKLVVNNRGNT
ncbi:terminase small subunit [Enterobacter roggenkampii]|uniref:terminase small subunit n=1 Tax=Enterobacter roggenkampii TaxID=1812935 RepID=UPI00211F2DB3|nr:terminase small subunit [Enterobacter roggenkampii]MDQ2218647.1 terminase small subunit [Enterobacter roggenkampii]